jgi:hypothetical protein
MTTWAVRSRSGINSNPEAASRRIRGDKDQVIENRPPRLSQPQSVDQRRVPAAAQTIGQKRGTLSALFGHRGKASKPAHRPEVGQPLRQWPEDFILCRLAAGHQDLRCGGGRAAELSHHFDESFDICIERHEALMRVLRQ